MAQYGSGDDQEGAIGLESCTRAMSVGTKHRRYLLPIVSPSLSIEIVLPTSMRARGHQVLVRL